MEVVEVREVVEVVPRADSCPASDAGDGEGKLAAGSVTAAGGDNCSRDWMVPVTSPASRATFQSSSETAGSRRRRRVTSQTSPRSTVLWIR